MDIVTSMAASGINGPLKTRGLRRSACARALLLAAIAALMLPVYGCSLVGSRAKTAPPPKHAKSQQQKKGKSAARSVDESGGYAALPDWESFSRTREYLDKEIGRRAKALRQGAVGNLAAELASLRMSAKAPALIDKGSLDAAIELLERAVSMYGGNGFAYLFLAYVHHVEGDPGRASGFLSSARRYLPADKGVRGETEGLGRSISQSAPVSFRATSHGPGAG